MHDSHGRWVGIAILDNPLPGAARGVKTAFGFLRFTSAPDFTVNDASIETIAVISLNWDRVAQERRVLRSKCYTFLASLLILKRENDYFLSCKKGQPDLLPPFLLKNETTTSGHARRFCLHDLHLHRHAFPAGGLH